MRFYLTIASVLMLFSGCGSAPEVALAPKLSHYTTAQQQCNDFSSRADELDSDVEKACSQFTKRLERANSIALKLENKKLKKGEALENEKLYSRERLKVDLEYSELSEALKAATLAAIREDNVAAFTQAISFSANSFIAPYYDYMKSKAPQFDNHILLLDYQRKESTQLIAQGESNLQQGNKERALLLFEQAADLGDAQAARSAGLLYEESNPEKAVNLHKQAVDGGVKDSYLNLGLLYDAQGQKEDALSWYLKSAAENSGKAQYRLYLFFLDSDKNKALSWLKKSADNGYDDARYSYALLIMQDKKIDEAISLLQQASKNNYTLASDYLGEYFYNLKLFKSAFEQLKRSESAKSFYLRAKMLEEGNGMPTDFNTAYDFYAKASALGMKSVDKDLQRINEKITQQKMLLAQQQQKLRMEQMAKMVKQCGSIPTRTNIKKRDRRFHITGIASAPLGRQSFIIYGDDGRDYYLLNARGIKPNERVDISVISTGSTASVISEESEEAVNIYQFRFSKECVDEEEEQ